jgi:undecaprenyl-diphosphatase
MDFFSSIILGIAQGLGEFLPISSTAHLVLLPYFFNFSDHGLVFDVALHLGTLTAVLSFFWKDWMVILKLACGDNRPNQNYNKNTLWFLILATLPGVFFGFFLEKKAETIFRHPLSVATALFGAGLILYLIDRRAKCRKNISQLSIKDVLVIGFSQAVAVIPGVSRSGATITAALMMGFDRAGAARFSFLLSTPIIFGAAVLKLPVFIQNGFNPLVLLGITMSAISGYLAIKYLLKLVEKVGYGIFFWYRLALAIIIVLVYVFRA